MSTAYIISKVSEDALNKRFDQGWVKEKFADVDSLVARVKEARQRSQSTSIAFLGNIVTLWERFVEEYAETGELLVDLGSDQTSCHNPFNGGYYPVQLTFEQSLRVSVK